MWYSAHVYITAPTVDLAIDYTKNFEIETKINSQSGLFHFQWGKNPAESPTHWNNLEFTDSYLFYSATVGSDLNRISFSKPIKQVGTAILKIRRIGDKHYFFLDNELIYSGTYHGNAGPNVIYTQRAPGTLKVDYIRISYINL